jgi:hypothetical protein
MNIVCDLLDGAVSMIEFFALTPKLKVLITDPINQGLAMRLLNKLAVMGVTESLPELDTELPGESRRIGMSQQGEEERQVQATGELQEMRLI